MLSDRNVLIMKTLETVVMVLSLIAGIWAGREIASKLEN